MKGRLRMWAVCIWTQGSPSVSQHRGRTRAGWAPGPQIDGESALLIPYRTAPHSRPQPSAGLPVPPLTPPTGCRWDRTASAHLGTLEAQRIHLNSVLHHDHRHVGLALVGVDASSRLCSLKLLSLYRYTVVFQAGFRMCILLHHLYQHNFCKGNVSAVVPLCSLMILWVTLSTQLILLLKSSTYSCIRVNSSGRLLRPRTELATALIVSPILLRKPAPCFLWGVSSCRISRQRDLIKLCTSAEPALKCSH